LPRPDLPRGGLGSLPAQPAPRQVFSQRPKALCAEPIPELPWQRKDGPAPLAVQRIEPSRGVPEAATRNGRPGWGDAMPAAKVADTKP